MFFIGTEHDGLRHAVGALQIACNLVGHLAYAVFDNDVVVVVGVVVDAVFYEVAEDVALPFRGSPLVADVRGDIDDLEGREEAVVDAFLQAVGVERLAEIGDVRLIARFLRCGCHTQLDGVGEVLENLAPVAVVLRTSAMTLIDDDQVEELRLEQLAIVLLAALPNHLLIECEINLVGRDARTEVLLVVDFMDGLAQWLEVLVDGLVDEHVSVGEIEHLLHQPCLQKSVDDLEGGVGLARARCHHEQKAFLPLGNSVHGSVDGIALVVAGRIDVLARTVGLLYDLQLFGIKALPVVALGEETGIEFLLRGKLVHRQGTLFAREEVMLQKALSVGTERKRYIHHPGIFHCLLQAKAHGVVGILRLDDGDGGCAIVVKHIVGKFRLLTSHEVSPDVDFAIRELHLRLHRDVFHRPAFLQDGRRDESQLDVFLRQ